MYAHLQRFLPASLHDKPIAATLGLISDTHLPQRCKAIPQAVFEVLQGVDLLLHAGDVGELRVLDELSRIAPVIAVHGNDDTVEAQRELPEQQLITLARRRILLWHSHYPDRDEEMASRRRNQVRPLRSIERANRAGATIAIFGHWHLPLIYEQEGITVINPGAIAPGNAISQQLIKSVAILFLAEDGDFAVRHVDLAQPDRLFTPTVDWDAGFDANFVRYNASILDAEMTARAHAIRSRISFPELLQLSDAILPLSHRCWDGELERITTEQVVQAVQEDTRLSDPLRQKLTKLLTDATIITREPD